MKHPLEPVDPSKLMRTGPPAETALEKKGQYRANSSGSNEPDALHGAVNEMFAKFELAYHNQFHKAFPNQSRVNRAKTYWHEQLRVFRPAQIRRATSELVNSSEFMPTLAAIVNACRKDTALFGLPSPRRAYAEACLAPAPKQDYDWSHPAVYLAGAATGWSLLASEPETVSFPQFEYHYEDLCRQVIEGAELRISHPTPLPDESREELSREETLRRLRHLREQLGG